jgi:hypothetical protein
VSGWRTILAAARSERDAFAQSGAAPAEAQRALLSRILRDNATSAFGRAHGFDSIRSLDDFRAHVPVRHYDDLRPWLDRVAAGEGGVLTTAPVVAFEETGGSRSGRKLVPYTAASLASFRAAVLPWLASLADARPQAFAGRAYVAISPVTRAPRTIAGIPVGLASEGAYLGDDLVPAFLDVLAVPPSVAAMSDVKEWRFATLTHLLTASDLSIVSVWSPTFFLALLGAIPALAEPLVAAIRDPVRARDVGQALACDPIDTARLWPKLDTVSAWADGASRPYARRLAALLPHAHLQPKGLLATESAVTLSWSTPWPVPALASAVIEFVNDADAPHLCETLQKGETYRVVLTTPGGLYRYDLGDRVRCRGHQGLVPLLEFVGRDVASDLVGEKLSEAFVADVLSAIDGAACLAPRPAAMPFYELLVEAAHAKPSLAAEIDQRLCANPQYAYSRRMGQLRPVVLRSVVGLLERHVAAEAARGRRLADIKPPVFVDDASTYAALTTPTNHVDSGERAFLPSFSGDYDHTADSAPRV